MAVAAIADRWRAARAPRGFLRGGARGSNVQAAAASDTGPDGAIARARGERSASASTHRQGSAWSDAGRAAKAGAAAAAAARRELLAQRAASSARELATTLITSKEDGKIGAPDLAE